MSDKPVGDGRIEEPFRHLLDAAVLGEAVAAETTTGAENVLEAVEVHKRYGRTEVLRGVSFGVHRGDVKAILGPSGSGKSTLLRCLALLEPVDHGEVRLEGQRLGVREGQGGRVASLPARWGEPAVLRRDREHEPTPRRVLQPASIFSRSSRSTLDWTL